MAVVAAAHAGSRNEWQKQGDLRLLVTANCCAPQVETIMISIISMLSSPNDESPANVDAAKMWRENRDEFKKRVSRIVRKSQEML